MEFVFFRMGRKGVVKWRKMCREVYGLYWVVWILWFMVSCGLLVGDIYRFCLDMKVVRKWGEKYDYFLFITWGFFYVLWFKMFFFLEISV